MRRLLDAAGHAHRGQSGARRGHRGGESAGLPVVVYFSGDSQLPQRQPAALSLSGSRGCGTWPKMRPSAGWVLWCGGSPDNSLEAFLEEVEAALLIGDENPCREPERWRRVLAKRLKFLSGPWTPTWWCPRGLQPQLCAAAPLSAAPEGELPKYLVAPRRRRLRRSIPWKPGKSSELFSPEDITAGSRSSTAPSAGGQLYRRNARRAQAAGEFVNLELKDYEETRNHPECGEPAACRLICTSATSAR
jgi:deoxyribodipyrimidine photo-lyase